MNQDVQATAEWLSRMNRPLLLSHTKPDGDAFGSLVGLRELLRPMNVNPLAVSFDPVPHTYEVFRRFEPIPVWERDIRAESLRDVDGVVLLDTCAFDQLLPLADWLKTTTLPKVAFDHHVTRDVPVDAGVFDPKAAATCVILHRFARSCGWSPSPRAAEALLIGLTTDTGWFVHSNTNAEALRCAAELVETGIALNDLHQELYQNDTPGRVRLRGRLLTEMELLAGGRLAVLTVTQAMLQQTGATLADTENLINDPLTIGTVLVSVLLSEQKSGPVRISLRSRSPLSGRGQPDVDVAEIARQFGGGGHRRASGARLKGTLAEVRSRVVAAVLDALPSA